MTRPGREFLEALTIVLALVGLVLSVAFAIHWSSRQTEYNPIWSMLDARGLSKIEWVGHSWIGCPPNTEGLGFRAERDGKPVRGVVCVSVQVRD